MKIAITTSSFAKFSDEPLRLLREAGIDYVLNPTGRAITEDEAIELLQGCIGVAAGTEPLTRRVMQALPELKVISRCGTGMDSVDRAAAAELGIAVRNTPDAPTQAVAELTLGYALDLMRLVSRMDRELRAGTWKKRMGNLLSGKKVGLIGFGRIGRATGRLFEAFGCEVAFADPFAESDANAKMEPDALLAWADIVSLHCSKPEGGGYILDERRLGLMRPGTWVINAARGGLIDESALHALLASGHLAGAALDVFAKEPYEGPLRDLPNVILTPHVGSYAVEARVKMETDTIRNLLDALPR
ncbi:phosphoglycerate dehydrogenase [Nitratidesulfovibrio sp. D1]|uniref:phosphoglycerate dehydrogenase n=1 Tax=Nitratidesulfovibrio sp. D1 TaxID=3440151 RepID=UPI003EBAD39F